jgi:hypothetical protein
MDRGRNTISYLLTSAGTPYKASQGVTTFQNFFSFFLLPDGRKKEKGEENYNAYP